MRDERPLRKAALRFIVLLGVVSLLADVTYEGARSITGPFLALLGASATTVGFVAGLGELVGYGLRLASGYLSDRTGRYWTITFLGYAINLLAVPALALAGRWEVAAALMIAERTGKAIRSPARDALLARATDVVGHGWGFGLHEALDQIGAVTGPLVVAAALHARGDYRFGFALLLIPALLALSTLVIARRQPVPSPPEAPAADGSQQGRGFPRLFWAYLVSVAFVAAGYADFPLAAYHFQQAEMVPGPWIPLFYAAAMGADALAALVFGRLFDRFGLPVLALAIGSSALFAPLVFSAGFGLALLGMVLWGIGMGAQESIMRAALAGMIPAGRRGTAYGLFNTVYGLAWFAGSTLLGFLYDTSRPALLAFSVGTQLVAAVLLLVLTRRAGRAA